MHQLGTHVLLRTIKQTLKIITYGLRLYGNTNLHASAYRFPHPPALPTTNTPLHRPPINVVCIYKNQMTHSSKWLITFSDMMCRTKTIVQFKYNPLIFNFTLSHCIVDPSRNTVDGTVVCYYAICVTSHDARVWACRWKGRGSG